jgi:hypothetical protein
LIKKYQEPHNPYSSPNIGRARVIKSRRMKWEGSGDNVLVEKPEDLLEQLRRTWEDNIKMDV